MPTQFILCLATSRGRADRIIHELLGAGFAKNELGVLFLDRNAEHDRADERKARAPGDAAAESAGPIRGVMASISGIRAVIVPDSGTFIAAGPLVDALDDGGGGPAGDGIAHVLIGLGVSRLEASRYESGIRDGHILIEVHGVDTDRIVRAREIFSKSGALHVCTPPEPSTATDPAKSRSVIPAGNAAIGFA